MIRKPAAAGRFYPGNPATLRTLVESYLSQAEKPCPQGEVLAVMAPHAGYVYSAAVAAPAYLALAQADFETAVIIGHDFGAAAGEIVAIFEDADAWETPLGTTQVDTALRHALLQELGHAAAVHSGVHAQEHTIEVHLPFLQTLKPEAKILPILFGEATPVHCQLLADALARAAGNKKLLLFASTDLSHYPSQNDARQLDRKTVDSIALMDLPGLCARQHEVIPLPHVETTICSAGGVGTAIAWCRKRGVTSADVLARANSGDVRDGESREVVGYASAMFVKKASARPEFSIAPEAQRELLKMARERIKTSAAGLDYHYEPPEGMPDLHLRAPAFVTLHKNGRLRGCIGYTVAQGELWEAVYDMAHAASQEDPRFQPVTTGELRELELEISVLSPMRKVASADEIQPGVHGVLVRRGGRSGLFLPQVWEQLPDKVQFLSCLCEEKAGLPPLSWQAPDTTLLVFTVFAFSS
ncbi:MAG: AmmeMemoRadiSam system protein B [Victivallales bacterium]|nr:AmmeMemoRadiSam system protein B [Victivallales bacterium]